MRTERGRGSAPDCPFCGKELPRPGNMTIGPGEEVLGGTCSCGALYLVDQTATSVGLIMSQALGLVADARGKNMIELVPDEDYVEAVLSYDWKTHRSIGVSEGRKLGLSLSGSSTSWFTQTTPTNRR